MPHPLGPQSRRRPFGLWQSPQTREVLRGVSQRPGWCWGSFSSWIQIQPWRRPPVPGVNWRGTPNASPLASRLRGTIGASEQPRPHPALARQASTSTNSHTTMMCSVFHDRAVPRSTATTDWTSSKCTTAGAHTRDHWWPGRAEATNPFGELGARNAVVLQSVTNQTENRHSYVRSRLEYQPWVREAPRQIGDQPCLLSSKSIWTRTPDFDSA